MQDAIKNHATEACGVAFAGIVLASLPMSYHTSITEDVPGTDHNFVNTGTEDLKIYTLYAPPNHINGRVQKTKADADADTADEAVGEMPPP